MRNAKEVENGRPADDDVQRRATLPIKDNRFPQVIRKPVISFCTSCFNRAWQLKRVFKANAAVVAANPEVEWVILNYASEDDLHEFMLAQLPSSSCRIVYARETTRRPWHMSVAKNMAHRVASGSILMNLDADNFVGNSVDVISGCFEQGVKLLHLRSKKKGDGTYGRIALTRDLFHRLGGYDESFLPMGFQDVDLVMRALASGWGEPAWGYPAPRRAAIPNSKADKMRYCLHLGMSFGEMRDHNHALSRENLAAKRYVANLVNGWCSMDPIVIRGRIRDKHPSVVRRRKRRASTPKH